ncbi:MAG: cyclic nucleotide-binding domain-containing protein [Cyanobacteriota bacterium]|nr:cyclic nucleotide-binding domain-containing protein [Cyanobacteriota bacterium]
MTARSFSFARVREHLLFQTLSDEEWQELLTYLRPSRYQPAQTIFQEGDASSDLYLILSGVVELRRQFARHPGDYLLATLHAGRVFGEMSLLTGRRRTTTAIAIIDVEAAQLPARNLTLMSPPLQVKLHRAWGEMIGERLHALESMFADLLEQRGAENAAVTMATLHQRYQP